MKIMVSACLAGENCKYNGGNNQNEIDLKLMKDNDVKVFLSNLPHQYFDEDQLHAFVISLEKEFDKCIEEVEAFLPFVDNWATCDQLSPKAFKKEPEKLIAWYFATALAKQYEAVLPYLKEKRLDDWVHNKAIQKSVESYRITDEQKAYLKTLKVQHRR